MPEDESPVRKKLRKALVKKLLGREANTDPTIQAAASSEVKQLLALPRLTEQDLNAAERRINQLKAQFQMYPEPNMPPGGGGGWVGGDNAAHRQSLHQQLVGWRAPKVPLAKVAPERGPGERHSNWERFSHHGGERRGVAHEQKAGTLSTSRARRKAVSMDQASHHAVPRLTDRELRAIPTLELVELIQALAAPEFLANHKLVGPAKMLAAKFNKENITSIYNLLFDLGLFRHGGGRGQARRASRVAAVPPSSKQKEPGMLEKKNIHMSYDDEQPPWQVKHKNSTPLETARMPRMGSFLNPKIANALPPVNGAGFNAQEYAQKSPYLANAPFGAAGYAGEADEPFQRSHWDARRVPAVSQEDWSYYEEKGGRDFVKENQNAAVRAPLRPDAARLILKEDQAKPPHAPGEIPEYLQKRKQELARREVQKKLLEQPGLQPIPDEQRLEVLANLQQRYKEVSNELGMLSFRGIADSHVRPMVSNKAKALETQLRELETAIRHFSRQKVYISS